MRPSAVPLLSCLLLLLLLLCVVVEVRSQTQTYPFIRHGRDNPDTLSNHSYVNLTAVGTFYTNRLECHTDLVTCCTSNQGDDRGDWFFPNESIVQFRDSGDNIYQRPASVNGQQIYLRRRNNGGANGIYQCTIETNAVHSDDNSDTTTREIVYVGLYASGGEMYMCSIHCPVFLGAK